MRLERPQLHLRHGLEILRRIYSAQQHAEGANRQ